MKILSRGASYFLLTRSVRAGMQRHAFLQSIKRSFHPTGPNTDEPFNHYKQVLRDEINRKKMTLAGDTVMLDRMMDDFYVPVYIYIKGILDRRQSSNQPVFIGISAPQGCGKTTLTEFMRALFTADGKNCLSVSIDDFYLRGDDQDSLAARYDTNPLLKFRGNAGSHDMSLMLNTLQELKGLGRGESSSTSSSGGLSKSVKVPQYDKSLRGGRGNRPLSLSVPYLSNLHSILSTPPIATTAWMQSNSQSALPASPSFTYHLGDRAEISSWLNVHAPLDVVLFEGWMLGFTAVDDDENIDTHHAGMVEVNRQLRDYLSLHEMFDAWLVIAVEDDHGGDDNKEVKGKQEKTPSSSSSSSSSSEERMATKAAGIDAVYRWRLQAETSMRAAGKPGLTNAQVADFISRFMPAYEMYLPKLYTEGPQRRKDEDIPVLKVVVDINRYPVSSRLMNNNNDNNSNNNNVPTTPKSRL